MNLPKPPLPSTRTQAAAEVLELGETLFDTAIEAALLRSQPGGDETEAYPVEDLRVAAREFFTALRVLLGLDQDPISPDPDPES